MVKDTRNIEQDKKQIFASGLLSDETFEENYQQKCKENDELLKDIIELSDDDFHIREDYINTEAYTRIRSKVSKDPLVFCDNFLRASKNGLQAKLFEKGIKSLKNIKNDIEKLSEDGRKLMLLTLRQDPRKQGCDEALMISYLKAALPFLNPLFPPKSGRNSRNIDSDGDLVSSYGVPVDTKSLDAILIYRIPGTNQTITFDVSIKYVRSADGGGAQDNQRNDLINHLEISKNLPENHHGVGIFAGQYFTQRRLDEINKMEKIDKSKASLIHIKDFGIFCCDFIPKKVQTMININDEIKQYVSQYFSEIKSAYENLAETLQSSETNNLQLNNIQTNNLW